MECWGSTVVFFHFIQKMLNWRWFEGGKEEASLFEWHQQKERKEERKDERFIIIFSIVNIALGLSCNAYCYHHHCCSQPAFQNEMKCGWRCCWRRSESWVGGCVRLEISNSRLPLLECYLQWFFIMLNATYTLRGLLLNVSFRILNVLQTLFPRSLSRIEIENLNNLQLNWLLIFFPSSIELLSGLLPFSISPPHHRLMLHLPHSSTLRHLCRNRKKMLNTAQVAKFDFIIGFFPLNLEICLIDLPRYITFFACYCHHLLTDCCYFDTHRWNGW